MTAAPSSERRLRLGLVGCGWVVRHCYQPALEKLDALFDVVVVADPDPLALRFAATSWPAARLGASLGAVGDSWLDLALIASPNAAHLDHAETLLRAGTHCLIEKPVVRDRADAARLRRAMRGGARAFSGVACRFRDDTRLWLRHVARLGRLTELELCWVRENGVPQAPWHLVGEAGWTGAFADLGYHLLDIAGAALGWRCDALAIGAIARASQRRGGGASWYARGNTLRSAPLTYDCDDRVDAVVDAAGCRVGLRVAWVDAARGDLVRLVARGAHGEAELSGLFGFSTDRRSAAQQVTLRLSGEPPQPTSFAPGPALQRDAFETLLRHVHRCIVNGVDGDETAALDFSATVAGLINGALR